MERRGCLWALGAVIDGWLVRRGAAAEVPALEARRQLAAARIGAEEMEGQLEAGREVRRKRLHVENALLAASVERERLLLEQERLSREAAGSRSSGTAARGGSGLLVEPDLGDRHIESMAVRAVVRLGTLAPGEADAALAALRRELARKLPPYAAAEVARRVEELRDLSR